MENEKGWKKVSGEGDTGADSSVQQNVSASEPAGHDYSFAPHGRDANGVPLAPYGWTKDRATKKFRVKKAEGRGSDQPDSKAGNMASASDDAGTLLEDLKPPQVAQPTAQPGTGQPLPNGQQGAPQQPKFEVHISGAMFLFALDVVVPGALALIYNTVASNAVTPKQLKLDAEEKADLTPSADAVVKELLSAMSPLQQFFLFTFIMYGSKLMYAEKLPKVKKQKVSNDEISAPPKAKPETQKKK